MSLDFRLKPEAEKPVRIVRHLIVGDQSRGRPIRE